MTIHISIVCPVYNEEKNIDELYAALARVMPDHRQWELLLIDDGSHDSSPAKIRALCKAHPHVRAIFFSKNFGHQIALTAGLDHARGNAVITMDSDLQHPPERIPEMIRLWEQGAQIVLAVRDETSRLSWFKRTTSRAFYTFLKAISHVDITSGAADFRLLDRKVVNCLKDYRERDRFLRGIIGDMGFRRTIIRYQEEPRRQGKAQYDLIKMVRLAITGVISFSSFPLRICSIIGFIISFLSFLYAAFIILDKFINGAPVGIASILVGVFFIGGLQLIFIGILGEYLMTVFKEVKARPLYNISEIVE